MSWLPAWLNRLLPQGSLARSVALLAGGSAVGQGLLILTTPILTRLYSPEDFGVFGVYASILGVLLVVVSLRYELAIPLPEEDEAGLRVLVISLVGALLVSAASAAAVWWFGEGLATRLGVPVLAMLFWLLPVGLLAAGVFQALTYWAIRRRNFRHVASSRMAQGTTQAATAVGLGWWAPGPAGLLVADLVGRTVAACTLILLSIRGLSPYLRRFERSQLLATASRYRRYPLISSGSGLLNQLGLQLPTLLTAALYGAKVAGWYDLTQRLIGVPMTLVGGAVAQVYLGEASRLVSQPLAMRRLFTRMAGRLTLFGGVPILALGLGAPWLFAWIFGEEWTTAGRYAQILALSFAARFMVVPLSQTLNILARQDLQLYWDVARLALVGAVFGVAAALDLSPTEAMAGYGGVMLISYVGLYVLSLMTLDRQLRSMP